MALTNYTSPTAHIRANCYDDAKTTTNPQGNDCGDYHASVSVFRTFSDGTTKGMAVDHIADIRALAKACAEAIAHHEKMETTTIGELEAKGLL